MALHHYLVGNKVVLIGSCSVVDPLTQAETPTTPATVTFTRNVNGTLTTYTTGDPEVTNLAVGIDACTVTVTDTDETLVEKWRYEAVGNCDAAAEDEFKVIPSVVV